MNLFNTYTKWQILETYIYNGVWYCVQVKMNKKTGYKKFKVNSMTNLFHYAHGKFSKENIEKVLN